ncbi:MAG: GTP cyclohydrolase I FolE [Deltaproteobacteria bacterium]|nr:MAG: GTP cyclohydrolase I FolE [Deltaproteobacteria bacterium]
MKKIKNKDPIEPLIYDVIKNIGEDPDREGLLKTPHRVATSLRFLTSGYQQDIKDLLNGAIFNEANDEMVTLKDISLYSLCEHHLLPFFGRCHIAYIPNKKIIGLSKLARLVDMFSRRLQVQERLTKQIAETLQTTLKPLGVAVVIEAEHLCMQMRGVQKRGATMVTSAMLGGFRTHQATREEFLKIIKSCS